LSEVVWDESRFWRSQLNRREARNLKGPLAGAAANGAFGGTPLPSAELACSVQEAQDSEGPFQHFPGIRVSKQKESCCLLSDCPYLWVFARTYDFCT
jgi:hypothetical protein